MALGHEEPDRVPIDLNMTPEVENMLSAEHGGKHGAELRVKLGHDILITGATPTVGSSFRWADTPKTDFTCDWGVHWKRVTNPAGGQYNEVVGHPLAGVADLSSYQMPDPERPAMEATYRGARDVVEKYGKTHVIFGTLWATVFESAWFLRGMENLLMDMMTNKDYAHELFDMMTQYALVAGKRMIETGVDVIWTGDDFGTQRGMLISLAMWREFIRPRYATLYAEFKRMKPDLRIAYHSDGYIEPIIPDLIEIGLDILNPIQLATMDPAKIKRKYGDFLSFWGTVDVQWTLPFGTPVDVEREIKERLRTVAPGGGFILCSAHAVQPDFPLENIRTFYRAARTYGTYPIRV